MAEQALDRLFAALGMTSPPCRTAELRLHGTGAEIADALEITLATVKWRIYKAREEVQLALAREGITLRHRTEAGTCGWQLKLPVPGAPAGVRDEIHEDGGVGIATPTP